MNVDVSDEYFATKLRRENIDQFNILVRMHLSFVLDLNTDESEYLIDKGKFKKWHFVSFNKKPKCPIRGIMDGVPLTQEGICQVYQLIEFLKKESNIGVEGIFRRTGSLARQQELRNLLNQGVTLNLETSHYSVHDCASVLKGFLSDLPEPLLTDAHYAAYCQIAELCGVSEKPLQEERLLQSLQLLLLMLPAESAVLLKDVIDLLHLTVSHESTNKMSADSLATLFTPHLLCPRKLPPETLHVNSQTLSGIISFMIVKSSELFCLPPKLAIDIRAYFTGRERRKILSPNKDLNESLSDNFAANTVFSFVDHERTTKENSSNPTETALAQLYAHIQSLPESSKKRKLIKQFNKENGFGTPLQKMRSNNIQKNKSFGNSIKKHIFQTSLAKSMKKGTLVQVRSSSEELLNNPQQTLTSRSRLFCTQCDTSNDISNDTLGKKVKISESSLEKGDELKRSLSESDLNVPSCEDMRTSYLTSTPACLTFRTFHDNTFTPKNQGRKSMSPITRSTQRMTKAMQETMMTPRSRKPVLLLSGTNINNIPKVEKPCEMESVEEESFTPKEFGLKSPSIKKSKSEGDLVDEPKTIKKMNSTDIPDYLTTTFKEYLQNRSILALTDLSFSSRTDDYHSNDINDYSESKVNDSLLNILNGECPTNDPNTEYQREEEKELILKPKEFDENGEAVVYETSF